MSNSVKITLGGQELEMLPLTLGALKRLANEGHLEAVSQVSTTLGEKQLSAMIAFVAASLMRKYPDHNEKWVEDNVEASDLMSLFSAILKVSGFGSKDSKLVSP